MHDQQISVSRVAYELVTPTTTTVYEIMSNHLGMKKASTRWVPKLLTSIQRDEHMDCCQEFLQENEINLDNYFDPIVTGDKIWVYYYDPLSQQEVKIWKKPGEETATRVRRTRSTEKIMMAIFWEKYGILLIEHLPRGITISSSCYTSIIEWLRCAILEKRRGKVSY